MRKQPLLTNVESGILLIWRILMKITAFPCLCADVFVETGEIRPGGEELNFAAHAAEFDGIEVSLIGAIGDDEYGKAVLASIADKPVNTAGVRVDGRFVTANNRIFLTADGDRYFKEDSWNGKILENFVLSDENKAEISRSDAVFTHFDTACFAEAIELKKKHGFKLAVDFDVYRDFEDMKKYAPHIDFFLISGEEELLHYFKEFSLEYDGYFNMTLGANGSVTYHKGEEYRAKAVPVSEVIDTTGCGDSYHAGFVCEMLLGGDIQTAMKKGAEIASETLSHFGGF